MKTSGVLTFMVPLLFLCTSEASGYSPTYLKFAEYLSARWSTIIVKGRKQVEATLEFRPVKVKQFENSFTVLFSENTPFVVQKSLLVFTEDNDQVLRGTQYTISNSEEDINAENLDNLQFTEISNCPLIFEKQSNGGFVGKSETCLLEDDVEAPATTYKLTCENLDASVDLGGKSVDLPYTPELRFHAPSYLTGGNTNFETCL